MRVPFPVRRLAIQAGYRLGGWPRRVAAGLCLLLAVASAVSSRRSQAAPHTVAVATASRNLSAGSTVRAGDVRLQQWPAELAPVTALRSLGLVVGHVLAGGLALGEPITSTRLRGRGIAIGLRKGMVATTVMLEDAAALTLIQPGDVIDVLAGVNADAVEPQAARVVATSARVLAVLPPSADRSVGSVVIAVDQRTALALAASSGRQMTATMRATP